MKDGHIILLMVVGDNMEIWKDIPNYEGLYQVSNLGRIKSLYNYRKYNILTPRIKRGYYTIGLRKNGKRKWHLVHRIVASAFIMNVDNKPQVNHIDENKLNNRVDNLEWCTASYNNNYGTRQDRVSNTNKLRKEVYKYDLNGNLIEKYRSVKDAAIKNNHSISTISEYCRNILKCKDYIFTYEEVVSTD